MKKEIQSQDHTEIYASELGYCCIQQTVGIDDPVIILICPNLVDEFCEMLQAVKFEAIKNRQDFLGKRRQNEN